MEDEYGKRRSMKETSFNDSGYSLRDHSKPPSRYRDFVDDGEGGADGGDNEKTTRSSTASRGTAKRGRGRPSSSPTKKVPSLNVSVVQVEDDVDSNGGSRGGRHKQSKKEPTKPVQPADEWRESEGVDLLERPRRVARARAGHADLSACLRENLRRLKNVLKLPKARRWVYCEFFYSGVDMQLFLGDNEFSQCLRESFPNLKCRQLTRIEWRTIRRLIGKPRRCSQAFLEEERAALEAKRARIRQIYDGTLVVLSSDMADLPTRLPRPLVVGAKIYARVRSPKDGIYAGTIDAVLPDSYRVVFDKEEMIPAMIIKDSEVMSEQKEELVALGYFLEQNRAAMPNAMIKLGPTAHFVSPAKFSGEQRSPLLKHDPMLGASGGPMQSAMHKPGTTPRRITSVRDEKVGNFPVRMLVMLVKLAKLIEMKRGLVKQLGELNSEAERTNLLSDSYPRAFQEKYAAVVVDMETLNRQLQSYLNGINEYNAQLLPQLSELTVTARPEALRKLCQTHALQIVKHCNQTLSVRSAHALDLVTALTALLLQVRSLGQQRCSAWDLHSLSQALADIRARIAPCNAAAFQDHVEIHMKQIHSIMLHSSNSAI